MPARTKTASPASSRMPTWLAALRGEKLLLAALAVFALVLWGLIELADEVLEAPGEGPTAVDAMVIDWLHATPQQPAGPDWLIGFALDLTALGGWPVLTLLVGLVGGYLALIGRYRSCVLVVAASALGALANGLLKMVVDRPRPDAAMHLTEVTSLSFPSGHSAAAAIIYLTLAAVVASGRVRRRERAYLLAAGVGLTLLVGLTRIYIGVHYLTDVLAGWSFGLIWTIACLLTARAARRMLARGNVPEAGGDEPVSEPEDE